MISTYSQRPIGEVLRLEYGKPLAKSDRSEDGIVPAYGANGVLCWTNKAYRENQSIIVGRKGSAGEINLTEGKFWPTDVTYFVEHNEDETHILYLYHLLKYLQLPRLARGVKPGINRNDVYAIEVPVPPLPEQKRIVAVLDEAFEGIDAAIANTQKNLASARELFESYLNAVFTKKGEGWEEKTLGAACLVERGSSPRPIKSFITDAEDGVNWIKIGDTKGVNKYIFSTKQKITPEGALRSRRVEPGDFILTNSMSYGRPYIMATSGYVHDGWFVLRTKENISTEFFFYLLSSNYVQNQFASLAAGAVVKNISGDLVKKANLPIPPIEKQHEIVKSFEMISVETQGLEAIYQQKLESLHALKQSLLAKAFSGELTAQPEQILKEAVG